MSALSPEQLDKLTVRVNEALTVLVDAFYDAAEEGGHFRQGPSGTTGNCSQCGSRWPCHRREEVVEAGTRGRRGAWRWLAAR